MAGYGYMPRNPYGFLGSRQGTKPVVDSNGRTGPVSSYFTDGNRESYVVDTDGRTGPVSSYFTDGNRESYVVDTDGRTGPVSSYFTDVNRESYMMTVETTIERVPPSALPAGSYQVARDRVQMSSSSTGDRPPIVEEFLKKIQAEVSQPARPAMSQSPFRFPRPAPTAQFGPATHVDFGDFTTGRPRPITESGFVVQSRVTPPVIRTTPAPPRPNSKISQATSDISEATEYLKELTRPSAPNTNTISTPQNLVPSSAAVNKGSMPETIDSREAARRYKNVIVSMEPFGKGSSAPILDSKAAKAKYNGEFV